MIGATDVCHNNIKAPENAQGNFLDRTMKYSVILIAVCKADKKLSYIQA